MTAYDNEALYKALTELSVIDKSSLDAAFVAAQDNHIPLGDVLYSKDLISDENFGKVVADLLGLPFVRLSGLSIPPDVLHLAPLVVASKKKLIVFKKDERGMHIAMAEPDREIIELIQKKMGIPIILYYATGRDIKETLNLYRPDIRKAFQTIIEEANSTQKNGIPNEVPVVKLVDTILSYGHQNDASDIHIEPHKDALVVRFRIDGILHDIVTLSAALASQVISRIKVLARLRIDEHQAAQDGKIQFTSDGTEVDVRVSIVPTTHGETVVLRLLSSTNRQFNLSEFGFGVDELNKLEKAYKKPFGMVLATGPTGSGKTTTLYGILKLLNSREVNIATIEDPVEFDIDGVTQIQVNPATNLTFAQGLKSIVRQDPNIILVGEIRDEETASIAVNSAMTGHLVLSTLHTNNAATTIPRLFDMGIEPFLIASTINVIIGQRLVRKICSSCRMSIELSSEEIAKQTHVDGNAIFGTGVVRLYQGKGCDVCHKSGYQGRIGIYEVMEMTENLKAAVVAKKDAGELENIAKADGMKTLAQDGYEKVKQGITTLSEVLRVTKE